MSISTIKVALLDSWPNGNQTMRLYLEAFSDIQVVGMATTGEEALAHLAEWQADILLLEPNLAEGYMRGPQLVRALRQQPGCPRLIALSIWQEKEGMAQAVKWAGVEAYLAKGVEPELIVETIRRLAGGSQSSSQTHQGNVITPVHSTLPQSAATPAKEPAKSSFKLRRFIRQPGWRTSLSRIYRRFWSNLLNKSSQ